MRDFNKEITQTSMNDFRDFYELKNLLEEATNYKNPENPSCIHLILTNNLNSFQNSEVMMVTFTKIIYKKNQISYIKLSYIIIGYLFYQLSTENIRVGCNDIESFLQICNSPLNEFALQKKKYSRGNNDYQKL